MLGLWQICRNAREEEDMQKCKERDKLVELQGQRQTSRNARAKKDLREWKGWQRQTCRDARAKIDLHIIKG